ncbi:MAG: hypothetical protein HC795_08530 [Coleofasciculaceae cyanobacterium RL_1_1]|nr:hypothetical protein [Coleofasciculaceae cyanobacterium RL_1_1]
MPPTSATQIDSALPISTGLPARLNPNTNPATARDQWSSAPTANPSPNSSPSNPLTIVSGSAPQPLGASPDATPHTTPGGRTVLPFERLHCFEDVADCFADLGLHFHNAIALVPSNPSYPTAHNALVIVSAPHNGALEIQFDRPISTLTACITSSRPMTMSAKNKTAAIIARSRIPSSNLSGSESSIPANHPLIVMAPAIYSVTFSAFDGQIAISDLSFSWATDS